MCLKTGEKDTPVFYAAFLVLADLPSLRASCELSLPGYFITFPVPIIRSAKNDKQENIQIPFLSVERYRRSFNADHIPLSCSDISSKHSRRLWMTRTCSLFCPLKFYAVSQGLAFGLENVLKCPHVEIRQKISSFRGTRGLPYGRGGPDGSHTAGAHEPDSG